MISNQGEAIMQERTEKRMAEFYQKPLDELRLYPFVGPWDSKGVGLAKTLLHYLNLYHSDYRWKLKYY